MSENTQQIAPESRLSGPDSPEIIRSEVLADLFEASAARVPDKPALLFADRQLTYGELNAAADRVASRLIADGVRPGQIVGLWLPRGIDLLVMQLGIAKTGAAWLPFDADTPVDRIKVCLDDAESAGLVTVAHIDELGRRCWLSDELQAAHPGPLSHRHDARPGDPAYVIYTSGSTGKPKGILINQGAICHFLRSENAVLGIRQDDRVYQGFSVAFDMSFEEIWISYLVGATLWLAPKEVATDPEALPIALIDNNISVLHAVPTLLALFADDVPCLRLINLGGEACPQAIVERWARPGRQVFNTYGPTEATVSASLAELHPGQPVTIGRPLPNYGLLVIDAVVESGLRLMPQGETGELCITGPGVAAGYLGRPDLTAEKFLANPWATTPHESRLYRTGDLARIDETGQIHCLGRTDDQVKIRGFRVELGEIEATLTRQPGVGTAAVILRQDDGIERLVAYLIAEDAETGALEAIFRQEAKLSYSLLRLVNSAAIAPRTPITCFAQAINLLGRRQLQRWLQLLVYADPNNGQHPNPLLQKAAARGRLLELLAPAMPSLSAEESGDTAFMTGVFSLLDTLLSMSMSEILQQLPLPEMVHKALAEHSGPLGELLRAISAAEGGDLKFAAEQLEKLGIEGERLLDAQMAALSWAAKIRPSQTA